MGTGLVSLDLRAAGWLGPSLALFGIAAVVWLALALGGVLGSEVAGVPATSVIATRVTVAGSPVVGAALLVLAAILLLRGLASLAVPERARGSDLVPVVAIQSLAVVAASVWARDAGTELRAAALVIALAGCFQYARTIARFPLAQLARGRGDQWIAGGALAITGVACGKLATGSTALADVSFAVWLLAMAWLPALVIGEVARPRIGGPQQRWSTVFPVGMYAAMSFAVADATGDRWLRDLADVISVGALAVWALVLVVNLARG
jgi:hypothetical protein